MFQLIESISQAPIRFIPDTNSKAFEPGLIAQLVEINGTPSCTVSDGSRPFGVISEIDGPYGMISIWFDSMIFQTDKFEKRGRTYEPGNFLYVSKNGKLTTKKPFENSHLVGHVISGPDAKRKYIEINWI